MDQTHLARVRLLSQRFNELQGLRVALFGAAMAIGVGGYRVAVPTPTQTGFFIALGISLALAMIGMPWMNRYYASTFGRQVVERNVRVWWKLVAVYVMLLLIDMTRERFDLPPGTPTTVVVGLASVWMAIRDWPWRAHYLLATAAVAIPLAASLSSAGPIDRGATLVSMFVPLGVSMVLIGILDHRLLVKLMAEARAPETA